MNNNHKTKNKNRYKLPRKATMLLYINNVTIYIRTKGVRDEKLINI